MAWVRHLPSVIASSLLFGFIGTPLGTAVFFVVSNMTSERPLSYRSVVDLVLGPAIVIVVLVGAAPAFVTGAISGVLRIRIRPLLLLACATAPVGAVMTASHVELLSAVFGWEGVPKHGEVILTGAIAAFCCAFLLWRNRPWTL